jgi:hypothetical protein
MRNYYDYEDAIPRLQQDDFYENFKNQQLAERGITAADAAQILPRKKPLLEDPNFQEGRRKHGPTYGPLGPDPFRLPSIMKGLGAIRDKLRPSPEEQFGASYFPQTDTGRVYQDPNQSLYGGMNVSTIGHEGIEGAGQKRIDRLQKTIDNYQKQWGHLSQDEYDVKLKRRQDQLKQFKTQQAAYGQALAAQNIQAQKDKAAADAPAAPTGQWQPTGRDYTPEQYSAIGRQHYTGPGMAFEARPSASGRGPKKEGGYMRPRYSNGGRVGILAAF